MNKRRILAAALLLGGIAAYSQNDLYLNRGRDNWFVEAGGGINWMVNVSHEGIGLQNYGGVTPAVSLQGGKWFTPEVGARIGWQGLSLDHRNTDRFRFNYLHNDLLWNLSNTFWGNDPARRWEVVPYGHFGLLLESRDGNNIEREYAAGAGVQGTYALTDRLGLTLDLRALLLNGNASQGLGVAIANGATLGLRYSMGAAGWGNSLNGRDHAVLLNGLADNWFLSAMGGVNTLTAVDFDNLHFYGKAAPAAEISIGKWVTPQVGLRLGVQGITYTSKQDSFHFAYPHLDLLWNLTTTLLGWQDGLLWNLVPYAHYGAIGEFNDASDGFFEREYAAGLGVLNRFRLGERLSLDVDFRSQFLTADASGRNTRQHALGLSAMAGLAWNLGRSGWRTGGYRTIAAPEDTHFLTGKFFENWFLTGAGGVNYLMALHRDFSFNGYPTLALDFGVGKWFSPLAGVRLGWHGTSFAEWGPSPFAGVRTEPATFEGREGYREEFGFNYIHGDVLWNLTNTLYGYRPDRVFSLIPYLHFGALNEYGDKGTIENEFASGAGVLADFCLTDHLGLFADLRGMVLNPRASGESTNRHAVAATASAGIRYNLGPSGWYSFRAAEKARLDDGRQIFNGLWDNWFVQYTGGINTITSGRSFQGRVAPAAEFAAGKWLSPEFALRLGLQGFRLSRFGEDPADWAYAYAEGDRYREETGFHYLHGDVLWNVVSTLGGYDRDRRWDLIPYLHMGYFGQYGKPHEAYNREFAGGGGIIASWQVQPRLGAYLDLRAGALASGTSSDQVSGHVGFGSALAGLTYSLGKPFWDTWKRPYRMEILRPSRQGVDLGGFWDNWFLSVGDGANLVWAVDRSGLHDAGRVRNAGEISVGKWFAPEAGARLGYQGMTVDERGFAYVHADFLWNLTNTLSGYRAGRLWNLIPYLHMGGLYEYDPDTRLDRINTEYAGGAGLLNTFRLHDNVSLYADLRAHLLTVDASRLESTHDLAATALLGVTYHFGEGLFKPGTGGAVSGNLLDNWFVSTGAGVNVLDRVAPAAEVLVGKWFSPQFGARLGYQGLRFARNGNAPFGGVYSDGEGHEKFGFAYVHGDFLWDFLGTVAPSRKGIYSLIPYAHMGLLTEYKVRQRESGIFEREYAAGAGLLNTFALNGSVDAYIDLRAMLLRGAGAGDKGAGTTVAGAALAGLSCHLGRSGFDRSPVSGKAGGVEKHHWAMSTNLLDYADLGTVNAALEYAPARHWSVTGGVKFNAFDFDGKYDRKQTFSVGARWWPWYIYSGLWVKGLAQVQGYQREGIPLFQDGKGEAYGAGLSAGYALMLAKHFNLDFGVGGWAGRRNANDGAKSWFIEPNDCTIGLMFVF